MSEGSILIEAIKPIEPKSIISSSASQEQSPAPNNPASERNAHIEIVNNLRNQKEYANAAVYDKLERQTSENTFPGLTVANFTDIDGTYIYDYKPTPEETTSLSPEELQLLIQTRNQEYMLATQQLTELLNKYNVPIIAVSGRDFNMVQTDSRLPQFDLVVGSVGTEIYVLQKDGSYQLDSEYDKYISQEIGFDRHKIYNLSKDIVANASSLVPNAELKFQDRDSEANVIAYQQDPQAKEHGLTAYAPPQKYKISFNFEGINADKERLEKTMQAKLKEGGCGQVKIVFSYGKEGREGRTGWNIDLIPETKKGAINYLVNKFGCIGIFGGDTGNDSDAIIGAGHAGFAVGNRRPEVDTAISEESDLTITKQTQNFRIFKNPDGTKRLLFVDSDPSRKGPESQIRALRTMKMFARLMKSTTANEVKSLMYSKI